MFDSMLSREQFCLLDYISLGFSVAASSFSIGAKLKNKIFFFPVCIHDSEYWINYIVHLCLSKENDLLSSDSSDSLFKT